jgi:hypothetical protein
LPLGQATVTPKMSVVPLETAVVLTFCHPDTPAPQMAHVYMVQLPAKPLSSSIA